MVSESSSSRASQALGVREDPTGQLRSALRQLIVEGAELESELHFTDEAHLNRLLDSIERWRSRCVALVRSGFEQEAVAELVRATSSGPGPTGGRSAAQAHRSRVRDALELLDALEGTLDRRGGRGAQREPSSARL